MTSKELKAFAYDTIVTIEAHSREIDRLRRILKENEEAILRLEQSEVVVSGDETQEARAE